MDLTRVPDCLSESPYCKEDGSFTEGAGVDDLVILDDGTAPRRGR